MSLVRVGTAGWTIPRAVADDFPAEGSGLARYASRFPATEINTSFYRPHRPATYERWAGSVPDGFRFAAKLPRRITHELRLFGAEAELGRFLGEVRGLGDRLGPLLVQLPPSLAFEPAVVVAFLRALRGSHDGPVAFEPRHPGWFGGEADALLREHRVARVAADPARAPGADEPGGWPGFVYLRLHGSPAIYRSAYGPEQTDAVADRLASSRVETWCIFDNTASGAAASDALLLVEQLGRR